MATPMPRSGHIPTHDASFMDTLLSLAEPAIAWGLCFAICTASILFCIYMDAWSTSAPVVFTLPRCLRSVPVLVPLLTVGGVFNGEFFGWDLRQLRHPYWCALFLFVVISALVNTMRVWTEHVDDRNREVLKRRGGSCQAEGAGEKEKEKEKNSEKESEKEKEVVA